MYIAHYTTKILLLSRLLVKITDLFTEIAVYVVMRTPNMHIYSTVIIISPCIVMSLTI